MGTPERRPLLSSGTPNLSGYASTAHTDSDEEGYASSDGFPAQGYTGYYALPSLGQQRVLQYRDRVLFWGSIGSFAASFVLLAFAGVLITTGRHRLRVEVDAASTVGVAASLFCAVSALVMALYRGGRLSTSYQLMTWSAFIAACILNGMLLVLVVNNVP